MVRRLRDLASFFYVQRVKGFDSPSEPHFDADTTAFFREQLAKSAFYLEFGSGGSTVLADRLKVRTLSVEGDRFYAAAVKRALSADSSVEMILPELGLTKQWAFPVFGQRRKGKRYVEAPFGQLDGAFPDLVLVDGRYRVACALASAYHAQKLGKLATLILDDYAGRPHYRSVEEYLGQPRSVGRSAVFVIGSQPITRSDVDAHIRDAG